MNNETGVDASMSLEQLAPQLSIPDMSKEGMERQRNAMESVLGIALQPEDPEVQKKAIEILGKFGTAGQSEGKSVAAATQIEARSMIAPIALFSNNDSVEAAAIQQLRLNLNTLDFAEGPFHIMLVEDVAIVGANSQSNWVKEQAIRALGEYANKPITKPEDARDPVHVVKHAVVMANKYIGALTLPAK